MATCCLFIALWATTGSRVLLSNDWDSLEWVTTGAPLPRTDSNMAVASYNHSIFIFGGSAYRTQAVELNLLSQTITDRGNDYLSWNLYGNSHYYTQIDHLFYAIDPARVVVYNLITKHVASYTETMPQNVGRDGCLSSVDDVLIVIGGISAQQPVSNTQIYNISSQSWTVGVPMTTARAYHACMVDPIDSTLYGIGGISTMDGAPMKTVERISIHMMMSEITTTSWQPIQNLSVGVISASAIMVPSTHEIYLFFGIQSRLSIVNQWGASASDHQIIDCSSGTVRTLSYQSTTWKDGAWVYFYAVAAISVDNTIYAFGGRSLDTGAVDTWQTMKLFPTPSPTDSPTSSPTQPTYSPVMPTQDTLFPTITKEPTADPSESITAATDSALTSEPTTRNPTLMISYKPTRRPSIVNEREVIENTDSDSADPMYNGNGVSLPNPGDYWMPASIAIGAVVVIIVIVIVFRVKTQNTVEKKGRPLGKSVDIAIVDAPDPITGGNTTQTGTGLLMCDLEQSNVETDDAALDESDSQKNEDLYVASDLEAQCVTTGGDTAKGDAVHDDLEEDMDENEGEDSNDDDADKMYVKPDTATLTTNE